MCLCCVHEAKYIDTISYDLAMHMCQSLPLWPAVKQAYRPNAFFSTVQSSSCLILAGTIAYDAALKGDKAGGAEDVKPLDSNTQVQLAIMATVSSPASQATLPYTLLKF